jgi:rhamnose transport system substrate-binding protein
MLRPLPVLVLMFALLGCGKEKPVALDIPFQGRAGTQATSDPGAPTARAEGDPAKARPFRIGLMPTQVNGPYFKACKQGAEAAAKELKVSLKYDGPTDRDGKAQLKMLEEWIASGDYDCLAISAADPALLAPALTKAKDKGLWIVSFDNVLPDEARHCQVDHPAAADVAQVTVDALAEQLQPKGTGKVALVAGSFQSIIQKDWQAAIKAYAQKTYTKMEFVGDTETGYDFSKGLEKVEKLMQLRADITGIISLSTPAVSSTSEAVRKSGKKGKIKIVGVAPPDDLRNYLKDDTVAAVVFWSPADMGRLIVHVADLLRKKKLPENGTIDAGALGKVAVRKGVVHLGKAARYTKNDIEKTEAKP